MYDKNRISVSEISVFCINCNCKLGFAAVRSCSNLCKHKELFQFYSDMVLYPLYCFHLFLNTAETSDLQIILRA